LALTIGREEGEDCTRSLARPAANCRGVAEACVEVDDARTAECIVACDGEVAT
jgi:hypothetical protein